MADQKKRPHRRAPRKVPTAFVNVAFEFQGKEYRAVLQNISFFGAGFRLEVSLDEPDLKPGDEIDFFLSTPYGNANCTGRIVWIDQISALFAWGIEFTTLSNQTKALIQKLIDSGI